MSLPLSRPTHGQVLPLWPDGIANNLVWDNPEEELILPNGIPVVRNVSQPSLMVYLPDPALANGTAMVVCPGGAYHFLAHIHEGVDVARWLNAHGVAAIVLKYRVIPTGADFPGCVGKNLNDPVKSAEISSAIFPRAAADGLQAVRTVRAHAAEWGIAPNRIGIMGFSAGGLVTNLVAHQYDASSRPDFAAPIYSAPPPELPIPSDAPPLFLLTAGDDDMAVPVSIKLYSDWRAAGHAAELHIYAAGGHGFGMNPLGLPVDSWIERLGDWMGALGLLQPPANQE